MAEAGEQSAWMDLILIFSSTQEREEKETARDNIKLPVHAVMRSESSHDGDWTHGRTDTPPQTTEDDDHKTS